MKREEAGRIQLPDGAAKGSSCCGGLSASVLRLRPGVAVDLGHCREEEL